MQHKMTSFSNVFAADKSDRALFAIGIAFEAILLSDYPGRFIQYRRKIRIKLPRCINHCLFTT